MTIREQIKALQLPEDVISRIIELTFFADSYKLDLHTSEFLLTQAFDWKETREGASYWFEVYQQLEYIKHLEDEKNKK